MPHNTLINGASHSLNGAQTIINGTGYKINSGKTLINGTSRNIAFETPKKWYWNEVLAVPDTNHSYDFTNNNTFTSYDSRGANRGFLHLYFNNGAAALVNSTMNYATYSLRYGAYDYGDVHPQTRGWVNQLQRNIEFTSLPDDDWLIAYLWANATPIYD